MNAVPRSPFAYVREAYGIPAFRGARVWYHGTPGRIIHATSSVRVEFTANDARANPVLRPYVRKDKPVRLALHPCEKWLAYDRETPERHRPSGWGSHVWSELCHAFGVNPYGSDVERAVAYDPALREPWPRDPRSASGTRPGEATDAERQAPALLVSECNSRTVGASETNP
jgi:hypothetical protein